LLVFFPNFFTNLGGLFRKERKGLKNLEGFLNGIYFPSGKIYSGLYFPSENINLFVKPSGFYKQ
jgi:hypothetical protein